MSSRAREFVYRYALAVAAVALATAARRVLDPWLGDRFPFATLFLAVLIVAALAGRGPALAATALGTVVAAIFLIPPLDILAVEGVDSRYGLILFVLVGSGIALLGGALRQQRLRAEAKTAEADQQRERLRVTLASIGDAVIATDAEGRVRSINPAAEALTGWPAAEAVGQSLSEVFRIVNESTRAPVPNPALRALREGVVVGLANHTVLIARDGRERPIDDGAAPIRDAGGAVIGAVLVFRDMTSRRTAESRLELAQRAGRSGMFDWDMVSGRIAWNAPLEQLYGLEPGSFEAGLDGWSRRVEPEDAARVIAVIESAIARRAPDCDYVFRAILPDGSTRWLQGGGQFEYEGDGRAVRMIGINTDVTERKRLEEALARQAEGLARQNERLGLLWEATTILLATDDSAAMFRGLFARLASQFALDACFTLRVDDSGEALRLESSHGLSADEARSLDRLRFGEAVCGDVAQCRRPLVASHVQQSDDPRLRLAMGMGFRAYACNPLTTGDSLIGTLTFASRRRDEFAADEIESFGTITRYVAAAYERLRLIGQLREADRRKDVFLATLAHELRNPLAPIRNALHLMALPESDDDRHEEVRSMAERQVNHLTRLVDDLMDVARITQGKVALRKEVAELAPIVAHAVESARGAIDGRGQSLVVAIPDEPIDLEVDRTRLEQILDNLLSNASKYTDPGGRIELTAERADGDLIVRVVDTGIGIEPEALPRIFEMFAQADPRSSRAEGGLGIGLGLVRSLVELHGGSIAARSAGRGAGSEFVVRLPALPAGARPARPRAVVPGAEGVVACRSVLVVDDNVDAATTLARLLKRLYGQEVRLAFDGPTAIEAALDARPDLVLLDIGMPGMDGYEVARRLRALPGFERTLIVALTGWGQEKDRERSVRAGFDKHLVKPVDPSGLMDLLAGLGRADATATTDPAHPSGS